MPTRKLVVPYIESKAIVRGGEVMTTWVLEAEIHSKVGVIFLFLFLFLNGKYSLLLNPLMSQTGLEPSTSRSKSNT